MTYRALDVSEWQLLEPTFAKNNSQLPNPRFAMIIGAFNDAGELTENFIVCQMQFHSEPLVVENPATIRGLVKAMEEELLKSVGPTHYYAFAPDANIAGIATALGLQKLELEIFEKHIE